MNKLNGNINRSESLELSRISFEGPVSSTPSASRETRKSFRSGCPCFEAREEFSDTPGIPTMSPKDRISPITFEEKRRRRSNFFNTYRSWQFFIQALIVWMVICLPGNIVTFILYREVATDKSSNNQERDEQVNLNTSSWSNEGGFESVLRDKCGAPGVEEAWVLCASETLTNFTNPPKSCSTESFDLYLCYREILYYEDYDFREETTEANFFEGEEYLCHETLTESAYYMKNAQFWLEGVCVLIVGGFGLIGNIMTLLVLRRIDSNTTYNKLLMTLAIVDFLLIFYYFLDYGIVGTFLRSQNKAEPLWYRVSYPYFLHPLRWIVVSASIFMIVAISAERYRAICYPLTHRPAFWPYFLLVLSISGFQNIPKLFEFQLEIDDFRNVTDYITTPLNDDQRYITFSSWWDELIVTGIIPFSALVIFNARIYLKLKASDRLEYRFVGRKSASETRKKDSSTLRLPPTEHPAQRLRSFSKKKNHNQHSGSRSPYNGSPFENSAICSEEGENTLLRARKNNSSSTHFRKRREKSAMILMSIVLTFLFCHTFRLVIQAYEVTHPSHSTPDHHAFCHTKGRIHVPVAFYVMLSASNLLLVVNSSMNFIIYCCVGKTFREELKTIVSGVLKNNLF